MNLRAFAFMACSICSILHAEISSFDDEDIRSMRSEDPVIFLTFPAEYAFTQAFQQAKELGYRFFSLIFFECKIGNYETKSHFKPLDSSGTVLHYEDKWIKVELMGYWDRPRDPDAFDIEAYEILLDLSDEKNEE